MYPINIYHFSGTDYTDFTDKLSAYIHKTMLIRTIRA